MIQNIIIDYCFLLLVICHLLSVTFYMSLAIWIFWSETCYNLQKLVSFRSCCTSRNFLIDTLICWKKDTYHLVYAENLIYNKNSLPQYTDSPTLMQIKSPTLTTVQLLLAGTCQVKSCYLLNTEQSNTNMEQDQEGWISGK